MFYVPTSQTQCFPPSECKHWWLSSPHRVHVSSIVIIHIVPQLPRPFQRGSEPLFLAGEPSSTSFTTWDASILECRDCFWTKLQLGVHSSGRAGRRHALSNPRRARYRYSEQPLQNNQTSTLEKRFQLKATHFLYRSYRTTKNSPTDVQLYTLQSKLPLTFSVTQKKDF